MRVTTGRGSTSPRLPRPDLNSPSLTTPERYKRSRALVTATYRRRLVSSRSRADASSSASDSKSPMATDGVPRASVSTRLGAVGPPGPTRERAAEVGEHAKVFVVELAERFIAAGAGQRARQPRTEMRHGAIGDPHEPRSHERCGADVGRRVGKKAQERHHILDF